MKHYDCKHHICEAPECNKSQDASEFCGLCVDSLEEQLIKSSALALANFGTPDCWYCGYCGERFTNMVKLEEHLISEKIADETRQELELTKDMLQVADNQLFNNNKKLESLKELIEKTIEDAKRNQSTLEQSENLKAGDYYRGQADALNWVLEELLGEKE
jgi:hypothetical protein